MRRLRMAAVVSAQGGDRVARRTLAADGARAKQCAERIAALFQSVAERPARCELEEEFLG